ncbi:MAG: hypothetical protein AAFU03_15950, partial [Bacteroidota bacterium]
MRNKIPYIIGASTVALLSLIFIQVKWMQQSRNLIEAQFDQKVSMALCRAVDQLSTTEESSVVQKSCSSPGLVGESCCVENLSQFIAEENVKEEVATALSLYQINMPFELKIKEAPEIYYPLNFSEERIYSCSLTPI